jgi:uncharacterized protein YtpQ (UPF0354 family)
MLTNRTRWIAVYLASALLPLAALAALSKEAFTQEFATVLRAAVPGHKVDIVEPLHLRITHPDGTDSTAYLDNAFKEYQSDPDARQELIERRVAAWVESIDSDGVPLDPKNIVPIIKDRGWVEEARTMSKARGFDPDESQVTEDYNDELVIVYAEDTPRNVRYFTSKDLAKAGVERSKLRALAIANLRRVLPKIEAHQGEVYSMYTADGNYEASLLLFDDLWDGDIRVDGDIVVAIPTRDVLLITGSKNAEGIARLREVADELTAEGTYTISPALFVYRKGKFRRFDP